MLEIPDPMTMITWDGWVEVHPDLAEREGLSEGDEVEISTTRGKARFGVHIYPGLQPETVAVPTGLGHTKIGRYADGVGADPTILTGGPARASRVTMAKTGRRIRFANVDGSSSQHERGIAQAKYEAEHHDATHHGHGGHHDYPLRLPIAEKHDPKVDIYPPHVHDRYRWGMIIDLDRCIGCSACVAACYAENNIASVGKQRVIEGREMAWIRIERYLEPGENPGVRWIPMLCQHCENGPCESVCPVYAPHHNKEGMNTQIYNRCIGTRFCSQNCPYKVRRFNFFRYRPDAPLDLQLNPDVTVRTKGVMEKCSFCLQRIKSAHQAANVEERLIRDGEVIPACAQTCPTGAISFGSYLDPNSRIREKARDERAYQVLAELLTKPGVIYLKKIIREDGLEKA
jgi:molybdopterin-containing oxidoreductase family iron-sulfur binding subunit